MTTWSQDELDKLNRWINSSELDEIRGWINATEAYLNFKLGPRFRLAQRFRQWVARAPAPLRILLWWLTPFLPSIIHGWALYPLIPFCWLLNIVTGHRYNSVWSLRVMQVTRTPISLIGFPWLLSLFSSIMGWVMFWWMLVYLVLHQLNGAALYEEIKLERQGMAEEVARRTGLSDAEAREMVTLLRRAAVDTSDPNMEW